MGEYATRRTAAGEIVEVAKIGTCDDIRYTRRAELHAWAPNDAGMGANCRSILAAPSSLYRFPWPDEDGQNIEGRPFGERSMFRGQLILLPREWAGVLDHHDRSVPIFESAECGIPLAGAGLNVRIPCPWGPDFNLKRSVKSPNERFPAVIYGERYDANGNGRTVFACAGCGDLFHLLADQVAELIAAHPGDETIARLRGVPNPEAIAA